MTVRVHTRLSVEPLSLDAAHRFAADPQAGAVVVFTGTVRASSDGRAVEGLTYEAWEKHALMVLGELAAEIAATWPAARAVWMEHRTGALAIGEPAVVVAVSAPHRPDAFDAARYAIDRLKATAPIWKQEHWADGQAHWPGTPA